ncbi:MAG: nitroreductase family protein [Thermodesulfovibrionales bacterium]|nr:nitroreductase family protein [Thermodesulfovibrionales bacterium]
MLEIIRKRRSVRNYINKEVESDKIREILKAAMFAPTAKNLRPWEFIVVKDRELKNHFSKATRYSAFAKDADVVIVICYDTNKGNRFKEDCAIAAQNIYLEAVNQGLGTCYIQIAEGTEGSMGEPEAFIKKLLKIPDHYRVLCLMPLGYPENYPPPYDEKMLFEESKIHYETFDSKY